MSAQQLVGFSQSAIKVLFLLIAITGWNLVSAQYQAAVPQEQVLQVNVNTADAETIADILLGVGKSRAEAIVDYRVEHGPFKDVQELIQVKGIGEATLETNKERIRLD